MALVDRDVGVSEDDHISVRETSFHSLCSAFLGAAVMDYGDMHAFNFQFHSFWQVPQCEVVVAAHDMKRCAQRAQLMQKLLVGHV